jgi:hypothetical protein
VTNSEFADAKLLWKLHYANASLKHGENACLFLLNQQVHEDHPLYYPLVAAIYVLYARPFTASEPIGRLPENNIVPKNSQHLHTFILKQRKEIYAHTDANSFDVPGIGPANQVRVKVMSSASHRGAQLIGTEFFSRPPTPPELAKLCRAVQQNVNAEVQKILARNFSGKLPKHNGEYPLNVFNAEGPFLLPKADDPWED